MDLYITKKNEQKGWRPAAKCTPATEAILTVKKTSEKLELLERESFRNVINFLLESKSIHIFEKHTC